MANPKEPRPPVDPIVRSNLYGLGALYLLYLYYRIAKPFLTHDPYGPTAGQFTLGTVILLGGAVVLGLLAWRIRKDPPPEEEPLPEEEEASDEKTEE